MSLGIKIMFYFVYFTLCSIDVPSIAVSHFFDPLIKPKFNRKKLDTWRTVFGRV